MKPAGVITNYKRKCLKGPPLGPGSIGDYPLVYGGIHQVFKRLQVGGASESPQEPNGSQLRPLKGRNSVEKQDRGTEQKQSQTSANSF